MISDDTLLIAVTHSNRIEGEPTLENDLRVVRACLIAAEEGVLIHPRSIHYLLFAQGYSHAGSYREVEVYVNNPTGKRMFPPFNAVPQLMKEWWFDWKVTQFTQGDIWARHVSFESIHPFQDGNGRVGRIFMWAQEVMQGQPITVFRYEDRLDYYSKMDAARANTTTIT